MVIYITDKIPLSCSKYLSKLIKINCSRIKLQLLKQTAAFLNIKSHLGIYLNTIINFA